MPSPNAGTAIARSSGCPPATIQRLVGEGPFTCYGSRVQTFLAYVQHPCTDGCGGTLATVMSPHWLDGGEGSYATLGAREDGASVAAFVPPALGRCSPFADLRSCPFHRYQGQWATVRARFNDPISRTCRYSEHPPGAEFSKKAAVAECQGGPRRPVRRPGRSGDGRRRGRGRGSHRQAGRAAVGRPLHRCVCARRAVGPITSDGSRWSGPAFRKVTTKRVRGHARGPGRACP